MKRPGFSLLELVLAIGLSIALVTLLGMAINLHLIRLDSSRSTVEQAQVARALLDQIATDLRAVTMAPTQDVSELAQAAEATAQFDVDQLDQTTASEDSGDEQAESLVEPPPGLYGTADSVTIDVRRVGQSLTIVAPEATPTARVEASWAQVAYGMSADTAYPGLVRTETPRDTARWRDEQGQAAPIVTPLANEVLAIRFAYFSSDQSIEQWDTSEEGALPLGVEVTIDLAAADDQQDTSVSVERRKPRTYRRFVRLPAVGEAPEEAAAAASEEETL